MLMENKTINWISKYCTLGNKITKEMEQTVIMYLQVYNLNLKL